MLIEVIDLVKIYKKGKYEIKANDNISFSINKGEIVGIIGPNGAGKTTLMKQIATLLIPDKGEILYKGISIVKHPQIIRGKCSFLLEGMQNVYHYLTGEANLLYFAYLNKIFGEKAKKRCEELLKRFGLYSVKDKYVFTYSAGMKKKLAIATCLINDPEIIFLDEPLSGLDPIASEEVTDFIRILVKEKEKTVIIASHNMKFIERVTDRVLWLKEGKIIMEGDTGNIKNLFKKKEIIFYLKNDNKASLRLLESNVELKKISNNILKVSVSLENKELLYFILKEFEVLNIEEMESDFEIIFKKLYDRGN
ncbi:MAG: ABC transporter ATP-binding protein [candidate division WOR-3 bacterium]